MTEIFVAPITIAPPGLKSLLRPGYIGGKRTIQRLDECSKCHEDCYNCPFLGQCRAVWDGRIENDQVRGWGGIGKHGH